LPAFIVDERCASGEQGMRQLFSQAAVGLIIRKNEKLLSACFTWKLSDYRVSTVVFITRNRFYSLILIKYYEKLSHVRQAQALHFK